MWALRWHLLAVCLWSLSVPVEAESRLPLHAIEFLTHESGRRVRVQILMVDRFPKALGTITTPQGNQSFESPVTEDDFRDLWNAIANLPADFKLAPRQGIDSRNNYIIALAPLSRPGAGIFMIPHGVQSEPILALVRRLSNFLRK